MPERKRHENGRSLLDWTVIVCAAVALFTWLCLRQFRSFMLEASLLDALREGLDDDEKALAVFMVYSLPLVLGIVCLILGVRGLHRRHARKFLVICALAGAAASAFLHSKGNVLIGACQEGWLVGWLTYGKLGPVLTITAFLLMAALIIEPWRLWMHPWTSSIADEASFWGKE